MVTGKELVDRLGMHPTSIQKAGFGMTEELDNEKLIQFLAGRRKAAGAWRPEKAAIADAWYCELTGEQPSASFEIIPTDGQASSLPAKRTRPAKPRTEFVRATGTESGANGAHNANLAASQNFLRSEGFSVTMLVIAVIAQTLHTATFFYFITPVPDSILRYATAGVVGIGVDAAALVATIQSQRRWYLWAFAFIHFGINMSAHFRFADNFGEIETDTIHFWFDSALLSGAVAFAVYCYSSVFAFKK